MIVTGRDGARYTVAKSRAEAAGFVVDRQGRQHLVKGLAPVRKAAPAPAAVELPPLTDDDIGRALFGDGWAPPASPPPPPASPPPPATTTTTKEAAPMAPRKLQPPIDPGLSNVGKAVRREVEAGRKALEQAQAELDALAVAKGAGPDADAAESATFVRLAKQHAERHGVSVEAALSHVVREAAALDHAKNVQKAGPAPEVVEAARIIKSARMAAGMTQKDLAETVGAVERTVRMWEAGEAMPSAFNAWSVAAALNLSLDQLDKVGRAARLAGQ